MTNEERERLKQLLIQAKSAGATDGQLNALTDKYVQAIDPERQRISGYEATGGIPAEPVTLMASTAGPPVANEEVGAFLRNVSPALFSSNLGAALAAPFVPETFDELQKLASAADVDRQQQYKWSSLAGGVVDAALQSIVLGAALPGLSPLAAQGAGWARRAASTIPLGLAMGATQGLGSTVEPIDQPLDALARTAGGAAIGGVAAPVASAAGSMLSSAGRGLYNAATKSPLARSRAVQALAQGLSRVSPTLGKPENILKHASQQPPVPGMPWTPGTATAYAGHPVGRELTEQGLRATAGSPRAYAAVVPTLKAAQKAGGAEAQKFVDMLAGPVAERPFVAPAAARNQITGALARAQQALSKQGQQIYGPTAQQMLPAPALDPAADPILRGILRDVIDPTDDIASKFAGGQIERGLARSALSEVKKRIASLETAQKAGQSFDVSLKPYQRVRDMLAGILPPDESALNAAYAQAAVPKSTLVSATKGLTASPDTALARSIGALSPSELSAIQTAGALRSGSSEGARMAGQALAAQGEQGGFTSLAKALQDAQYRQTGFGQNIRSLLPQSMAPQVKQAAGAARVADIAARGIQNVPGGGTSLGAAPVRQAAEAAINVASGRGSIGKSNLLRSIFGIDPAASAEQAATDIARVVFTPEGFQALAQAVGINNARAVAQSIVQQSAAPIAGATAGQVIQGVQ